MDPNERMEVSLALRRNNQQLLDEMTARMVAGDRSQPALSRAEFTRMFGATNEDRAKVKQFASQYGLSVVDENVARSTIHLSGTVAQMENAFDVQMHHFAYAHGTYRGVTEAASVPEALKGVVDAVMGLDTRPCCETHHVVNHAVKDATLSQRIGPKAIKAQTAYFAPNEFAALYNFPDSNGAGQCVAIIELGGGYMPEDNRLYFSQLGLDVPQIVPVSVDHASNSPNGVDSGADGEVALDIQVIGALAQGAKMAIYFAPNTDQGFLDAINAAVYDTINMPSVISISWGAPEVLWTNAAMIAMNKAFQAATAMGVTVFAASGDNGSTDGLTDGRQHADFPSSSPYVVGCGGTMVVAQGDQVAKETVWNNQETVGGATGGGISSVFALPSYQEGLKVALTNGKSEPLTMRGAPDMTGNADPLTGYLVMVNQVMSVIGGTSAVAPLMAALLARINALNGKPSGFIHPVIYKGAASFVPVTEGNNGAYKASAGWSAATGVGRPDGKKLQALLK
jgi:kumamolisin